MINGNPHEFIDHINHDDGMIKFRGFKYFFDPTFYADRAGHKFVLYITKYTLGGENAPHDVEFVEELPEIWGDSHLDCVNQFIPMKLWDGKSFWEVEQEMEWSDWDL